MKAKKSGVRALFFYLILLLLLAGGILIRSYYIKRSVDDDTSGKNIYSKHYALITGNDDQEFWT